MAKEIVKIRANAFFPSTYTIHRVKKTALTKIDAILKSTVSMLVSILSFNKSGQYVLYM